jgi:hypothetical protein
MIELPHVKSLLQRRIHMLRCSIGNVGCTDQVINCAAAMHKTGSVKKFYNFNWLRQILRQADAEPACR